MKEKSEQKINGGKSASNIWRVVFVTIGPLLLCLTVLILVLVPWLVLFSPFWILGLVIVSMAQFVAWIFGLAWYEAGGVKVLQKSVLIKNLQNKNTHKVYNFFGFMTALGIGVAILPYIVMIFLSAFLIVFGTIMEGALS